MNTFTPNASDVTKILRVKVEYTDQEGADKEVTRLSYYAVRAAPADGTTLILNSTPPLTSRPTCQRTRR